MHAFLRRQRRIALDTSPFIYQLEENLRYVALVDPIFRWIDQPGHAALSSTITMTELLVQPYRDGDQDRVNQFYSLLTSYPQLEWVAPDLEIADMAALLRARHRMRMPDALQAATAITQQVTGFITNDAVFKRVPSFQTLVLDDLL